MAEYTNLTCPVCKRRFSGEDDIVVCPVCGTPHHRACWAKEGQCANIEWHSQNKTFDAEEEHRKFNDEQRAKQEQEDKKQVNVCPRCGQHNDYQALFCNRCGAPISQGFGGGNTPPFGQGGFYRAAPFNPFAAMDSDEPIDGVETWKLSAVVRENQIRFIPQFKAFSKKKRKTSFNFAAFMFSPFYFFYRKMYGIGAALTAVMLVLNLPALILNFSNDYLSQIADVTVNYGFNLTDRQIIWLSGAAYFSSLAIMAIRILSGLFANWFYFKKCKKIAALIDKNAHSREEFVSAANKKGGVNRVLIISFVVLYVLVIWIGVFIMMSPSLVGF